MGDAAFQYLTEEELLELHEWAIAQFGGIGGLRDRGLLESCLAQPKTAVFGRERFATVYEKAAAYCFFITRNHPFIDGNKRTALLASLHFLLRNGVTPMYEQESLYEAILSVACGTMELDALTRVFERPYSG